MASNSYGVKDEDGDRVDWLEILNDSSESVDLAGWGLSDRASEPFAWVFPSHLLGPGDTLIVYASGKDRKVQGAPFHSNFKLSADGEYLGLHQVGGDLSYHYSPEYPRQVADVSYGLPLDTYAVFVEQGVACEVGVPVSDSDFASNFSNWKTRSQVFSGSSWQAQAHTGVGYDTNASYGSLLGDGGDILDRLRTHQRSVCLRVPFIVADPSNVLSLRLRMKWDDGFAAYINGDEIAAVAAPASPEWNSLATGNRNEALNNSWTEWTIPAASLSLQAGANVLAVHGFNVSTGSSDFLLLPLLDGNLKQGTGDLEATWFLVPTPDAANGMGGALGPQLAEPSDKIDQPTGQSSSPRTAVSVQVSETIYPLASVICYYRTMFASESQVAMNDHGVAPDLVADDGVFSAWLPTGGPENGEMLRWRFEALDTMAGVGRAPAFIDPHDSDEYFGSVALNGEISSSQLSVLHWFIDDAAAANTRSGTRASFYYLGEFYDNVSVNLHGQTSSGFPKKSYDVDFNRGNRFLWQEGERRVKDINLLTNYADRAKVRNTLSQEMGMRTGTVYHFCSPVRVEQNGNFYGVWDLMEDADDRMLERNGLDPNGAFYKMYNKLTSSSSGVEKKTRRDERNNDLQRLIDGLHPSVSLSARRRWAYDHVNIPATINYLVTRQFNSDRDHGHKNYFLYRDTENSGEWRPIVWDVDLSQGHNYTGRKGYFDDELIYYNPLNAGSLDNRLYNLVFEAPELREMFLRRFRTVMDDLLEPPGTVNGLMETRMREISAKIDPDPADPSAWTDGDKDFSKWGSWGRRNRCREDVEEVISGYLQPRRQFLFNQDSGSRPRLGGDPIPDSPQANEFGMVSIQSVDYLPSSGSQLDEYLVLKNQLGVAVDLSGWTLSGAIDHKIEAGTVVPSGSGSATAQYRGLLYVVKDAASFRGRSSSPRGSQRRLVQGNYQGQFSARGESVELRDEIGVLIASFSYEGNPGLLQQALRISEISYHAADPSDAELLAMPGVKSSDFEFIELLNISDEVIELNGAYFSNGIDFTFPPLQLQPDARVVVAANPAALSFRYGGLSAELLGPYAGSLNGSGERIELSDAVGEVIVDFSFKDGWYPATDGLGRSLVARNPRGTASGGFGEAEEWAISLEPFGSPGEVGTGFAQSYYGWDNLHFTSLERDDLLIAGPNADPDRDGMSNFLEYALGGNPRVKDRAGIVFAWMDGKAGVRFRRPLNAIDLEYVLMSGDGLASWSPVDAMDGEAGGVADGYEELILAEQNPPTAASGFLRLRVEWR